MNYTQHFRNSRQNTGSNQITLLIKARSHITAPMNLKRKQRCPPELMYTIEKIKMVGPWLTNCLWIKLYSNYMNLLVISEGFTMIN